MQKRLHMIWGLFKKIYSLYHTYPTASCLIFVFANGMIGVGIGRVGGVMSGPMPGLRSGFR